ADREEGAGAAAVRGREGDVADVHVHERQQARRAGRVLPRGTSRDALPQADGRKEAMTQGFLRASPGHPEVIKLDAEMQAEYVEMYGEPEQDTDNQQNQTEGMVRDHVDGEPAGIGGWKRWPSGEGKVCLVYVTPRRRRKGLALEMLIRMEEAMKPKGLHA